MRPTNNLSMLCNTHICYAIQLSKLQKCLSTLQGMRKEASFYMFFEKVKASARKPEIGELKLPRKRKFSNHYEERETLAEFVCI